MNKQFLTGNSMKKNAYSMLEIEMIFRNCKTFDEAEKACRVFFLLICWDDQERTQHLHEISQRRLHELIKS